MMKSQVTLKPWSGTGWRRRRWETRAEGRVTTGVRNRKCLGGGWPRPKAVISKKHSLDLTVPSVNKKDATTFFLPQRAFRTYLFTGQV